MIDDDTVLCKDCERYWSCLQVSAHPIRCDYFNQKSDGLLDGFRCHTGCP